jgi:hypothetical protein
MYLKEEVNTVNNTVGFDRTVDLRCLNARIGCSPTYRFLAATHLREEI